MKKLKDIIYDYNDIFLAVIIIAIAAGIIFWRVADIMAYPDTASGKGSGGKTGSVDFSDVDLNQQPVDDMNTDPDDVTTSGSGIASGGAGSQGGESSTGSGSGTGSGTGSGSGSVSAKETKITIPSGSGSSKIAQIVYDAGLCSSAKEFADRCVELKKDTKLQAGTFTIPAGSSIDDIINILTRGR
jgi:hypothetical protein